MRELNRFLFHLLSGIFAVYFFGFLFFIFYPENFFRDLFINFLPYIIAFHLPLILLYLGFHLFSSDHKKISRLFLLFFVVSLFVQSGLLISPYFHTSKSFAFIERKELKIISANVLKSNKEYQLTLDFIQNENPDVFGLIELTEEFSLSMKPLLESYPHQITFPYRDGFGIGLYSKSPLIGQKIDLLPGGIPYIDAYIESNGKMVHVFLIHAMPPLNKEMFDQRNGSLEKLSMIQDSTTAIVMGDFNLTPWSAYYKKFVRNSGLVSTRDMWNGIQHSWSSWGLYLPIDHVFISKEIRLLKYSLGHNIGSDHLPVIVELALSGPGEL